MQVKKQLMVTDLFGIILQHPSFLNELYGHPLLDSSTWDSLKEGELPNPYPVEFKCEKCPQA
jgi:hypothetical protein